MSIATDHVLATIASVLDDSAPARGQDRPANNETTTADDKRDTSVSAHANGYSKSGPGPMAAIRFKWTVRHGDDGYYVDETVGSASVPVSNGPMEADAAIKLVDTRAAEAHRGFDALKSEMIGPPASSLAENVDKTA